MAEMLERSDIAKNNFDGAWNTSSQMVMHVFNIPLI